MPRTVPARVPFLLFLLFFLGLGLNVFAFVDLNWTHWLFVRRGDAPPPPPPGPDPTPTPPDSSQVGQLRQSILNVRVGQCAQGGENVGTGFVVKAGYVATSAHILGDEQTCNGRIRLIDSKGREHSAVLDGLSVPDDLALLRISDTSLPALQLANSADYETLNEIPRLVTIGYPLEQLGASTQDSASISSEGNLSRFDREHNLFLTSGLNLNPGNSGGPIFLRKNWQVLGIVRGKLSSEAGEGIGYIVPIKTFESFFREKTGQELR